MVSPKNVTERNKQKNNWRQSKWLQRSRPQRKVKQACCLIHVFSHCFESFSNTQCTKNKTKKLLNECWHKNRWKWLLKVPQLDAQEYFQTLCTETGNLMRQTVHFSSSRIDLRPNELQHYSTTHQIFIYLHSNWAGLKLSFSFGDKGGRGIRFYFQFMGCLCWCMLKLHVKKKIKIHYLEKKKQTWIKNLLIHCFARVEANTAEGLNVAGLN